MSSNVRYVMRIPEGDRGPDLNPSGEGKLTEVYKLILYANDGTHGPPTIPVPLFGITGVDQNGNSTTLPSPGSEYDNGTTDGSGYFLNEVHPRRGNDPTEVLIEFTYSTLGAFQGDNTGKYNVTISRSSMETTSPTTKWAATDPEAPNGIIINSAGWPLAPRTRSYFDTQYTISFFQDTASFNPTDFDKIQGKLNSEEVSFTIRGKTYTFPARTLWCKSADFDITFNTVINVGQVPVYSCKITVIYRKDCEPGDGLGWATRPADYGTKYDDGSPFMTNRSGSSGGDQNLRVTEPIAMDGNGNPQSESSTTEVLLDASGGTTSTGGYIQDVEDGTMSTVLADFGT